jgi:hypothetical protein
MAREQQFGNGQRQVINTIEDTSKYQTGDGRRLRVTSDPLYIPQAVEVSSVNQLADALSAVKPELMNWAVNKKTDENVAEINTGMTKAQTGQVAAGELEQYGFDRVKSVNDWTEFQQKVTQDYTQNFDKENGDVEEFLQSHWSSQPFQDKSNVYTQNFTALATKTMSKIREAQGIFKAEKQQLENDTELTRMFSHDIQDVLGTGADFTAKDYQARRFNLREQFPGKTNTQLDELAYNAVLAEAQKSGDTSLFKIFTEPHIDGTPGLAEIPKWAAKINSEIRSIEAANKAARTEERTVADRALKDAAEVVQGRALFALNDAVNIEDPTEKAKRIAEITSEVRSAFAAGLPISDATIKTLTSAFTAIDKKQESEYQAQNYNTLRLGNPSIQQIAKAVNSGDISQAGFEKLMNAKDAEANRAATRANTQANKAEKPLSVNPFVKEAFKAVTINSGYSWGSMTPNNEQAKRNADAINVKVLEQIEEAVAGGTPVKEAAKSAGAWGVQMLKESGLASKSLEQATSKIEATELKRTNPLAYYRANPADFLADDLSKRVPASLSPKDRLMLQREGMAVAKEKARLHKNESTK